jgi:hypothetical protein
VLVLALPFARPGTYSSSTAWKLVPPKPNALTAAQRTPPWATSQGRVVVLTRSGEDAQSAGLLVRALSRVVADAAAD